jgi:hypothetical protein
MPLFIYRMGSPMVRCSLLFYITVALLFELMSMFLCSVIRASVPKMNLDEVFEQKNDVAKAVEVELEKVKLRKE